MPTVRPYSSRIIKASALIPDTKALLAAWDPSLPVAQNLDHARRNNVLGKASRSRVEDILTILRQRYFSDPDVGAALAILVQGGAPDSWLVPLFYFYSAQNDVTLRDIVLEVVYPRHVAGYRDLRVDQVANTLREWVAQGKTARPWGEETIGRVARGIMATLRDFGALEGASNKHLSPMYLPVEAFSLVAFWLWMHKGAGRVLENDEWKLFFLSVESVERFLVEAHQQHLLEYHAAGSVVRLDFPAQSMEEYAHALVEGAH